MTKKRGIGIASNLYGIGYGFNRPDHAAAYIEIGEDGTITLLTGCAEIGQGSSTILAQIAAEELGIDYESVRIITADTSVTPDAGPTTASRQAFVSGNAVKQAAQEVKKQLISTAAAELQVDAGELYVQDGKITNNEKAMEVNEAAKLLHQKGKRFIGLGWYEITMPDVDPETNQGHAYVTYIYATQMAEVEVDTETGVVSVLRIIFSSVQSSLTDTSTFSPFIVKLIFLVAITLPPYMMYCYLALHSSVLVLTALDWQNHGIQKRPEDR
jgi:CO/xanthine dehydrogenase Mo-binding subunit